MEKRMVLHETKQYSTFKFFSHNREIKSKNVEALRKNIEEMGLICPIIVTKDLHIIDGQHRLKALQELNMVVDYVVNNNLTSKSIIEANNTQKGWAITDFIHSFAKKGDADYLRLLDLIAEYNQFGISAVYEAFCSVNGAQKLIKSGEYKVNEAYGRDILDDCLIMEETLREKAHNQKFFRAIKNLKRINPNFDINQLLKNSRKSKLLIFSDEQSNRIEICDIYNKNLSAIDKIKKA